jgi:hypothetical protein
MARCIDLSTLSFKMDKPTHSDAIPGFTSIAPSIYTYTPKGTTPYVPSSNPSTTTITTPTSTTISQDPSLILLFTWTGALPAHIVKYTTHYQTLYPTSPILLITTTIADLIYRRSTTKQRNLTPAIYHLFTDSLSSNAPSSILVHCFSEGGSHKAIQFARTYLQHTGAKLPVSALILDSTPGHPRYFRLASAFKKSLPQNPIIRSLGMVAAYSILASLFAAYAVTSPSANIITKTRNALNDDRIWDAKAPRCYLYSKADSLISWRDIEEHGLEAEKIGARAELVRFEGSAHCAHMRGDEERYWGAVVGTWKGRGGEKGVEGVGGDGA